MSAWKLRLYVTGAGARSERAVGHVRALCEALAPAPCEVEVVDVLERPALADEDGIVVTPTLIKRGPGPSRRVFGDLGDTGEVVDALRLRAAGDLDPEEGSS